MEQRVAWHDLPRPLKQGLAPVDPAAQVDREGLATTEENLVTLCGACHKGLDPDFEPSLRELARLPGSADILDSDGSEHRANVKRYREWVAKFGSARATEPSRAD